MIICCAVTVQNLTPLIKQLGKQALVVLAQCRKVVLSTAHESPLAAHFGHRKTDQRLRVHFFWP